jgi:hypothetical protein
VYTAICLKNVEAWGTIALMSEPVSFPDSAGLTLHGQIWRAGWEAVILLHGPGADLTAIADRLVDEEWTVLTFDFAGERGDDLRSAIAYLRSLGYDTIAIWANEDVGEVDCPVLQNGDLESAVEWLKKQFA